MCSSKLQLVFYSGRPVGGGPGGIQKADFRGDVQEDDDELSRDGATISQRLVVESSEARDIERERERKRERQRERRREREKERERKREGGRENTERERERERERRRREKEVKRREEIFCHLIHFNSSAVETRDKKYLLLV